MAKRKQRQRDKQWSTKHYTENESLSNTNLTKIRRWTQKLRKDKQFLLHQWHKKQNEDKKQPQNTKLKIRYIYKYKRYIMYTKELIIQYLMTF